MKPLISFVVCITLSKCNSCQPLVLQEHRKRSTTAGGDGSEESFGFDCPDTGHDSPFPFGGI